MPVCRLSTILKDVPYRIQSRVLSTHRFNNRSITKATNFRFQTGPSIILVNRRQKVREAIVFRKYADKRGREQQLTRKLNGRRERERERERERKGEIMARRNISIFGKEKNITIYDLVSSAISVILLTHRCLLEDRESRHREILSTYASNERRDLIGFNRRLHGQPDGVRSHVF